MVERHLDFGSAELMAEARAVVTMYTPMTLRGGGEVTVLDTRDSADRSAEGWIPGSIHVPRTVLEWRADPDAELPDARVFGAEGPLVVVCNDGYSSLLAAAVLHRMGYSDVGHLEGGHRAWVAAGLPVDHG